jgi:hypothetical protein
MRSSISAVLRDGVLLQRGRLNELLITRLRPLWQEQRGLGRPTFGGTMQRRHDRLGIVRRNSQEC